MPARCAAARCPATARASARALIADPRVAGVAFTGSTETARAINRALAAARRPIVPLIAETGGQNAMIVDSSALPEQVVRDVVTSAFDSAGQRCSALRVLFVQEDVAERIAGDAGGRDGRAAVGDPGLLATDVGPVIDAAAREPLQRHAERMRGRGACCISAACRLRPSTAASSRRARSRSTVRRGSSARCSGRSCT